MLAQADFEFWPGATYDPAIPNHQKVLGYNAGDRITPPEDIVKFLEALAAAAPNRLRIQDYAKSWEGRRLVYAVIGSESNIRRLEAIKDGMKRLADPRKTSEAEADKLAASLPAVVWLAYGIHGNEISSPDAALLTAYHLLAARNDQLVDAILNDTLVIIDPIQNPDGRNRFVQHFLQSLGLEPNAHPDALEHSEPWPGGRTNHYLFDMNRDWFALTQPEIRGRVAALLEWYPLVFVDLHEMGPDSTYYFPPEAVPYNPHLEKNQVEALDWFGRNNARWFDHFGFSYFTREIFDAFYPGYGASWPSFFGSVAMTYEQASARGLLMRRRIDDHVFHFRHTVRRHFVASIATCDTAAQRRRRLLENFYAYRRTAVEEGANAETKQYILPRRGDVSAVDKLADLLARQGVEVRRTRAALRAAGREIPPGSYLISLAQPAMRLIRTLLDPDVPIEQDFIKEQERRRQKRLPDEIYDIVAWSLPLMYNVELIPSKEALSGDFDPVLPGKLPEGRLSGGRASVAYLVPWGSRAAGRLLTAALREGLKLWSADRTFELNGREFPRGTLILRLSDNPERLHQLMPQLAASTAAEVLATNTAYVVKGISLGSRRIIPLRKPEVAIAWDRPVSAYSAGHTRFVLERQFQYPVTPIRTRQLSSPQTQLERFDVLILPSGSGYASVLGAEGAQRLKTWVARGGTLIGLEDAVSYLADPDVDLLSISREHRPAAQTPKDDKQPGKREASVPAKLLAKEEDLIKEIAPEKEPPDEVPGVLVRARLDPDHWITAGLAPTVNVMFRGRAIFTPIKLDKGVNAAVFLAPDQLLAGGYLWEENRKQLAFKPFVVVQPSGRGLVIGFTADPNFRAYMDGLNVLFLNAVFRSQAPVRAHNAEF